MLRRELALFFSAIGFFTRLPVPAWVGYDPANLNRAARYFPAVGLVVGAIGAAVYGLALQLWSPSIAVLLSMAATLLATGAFHEDGLSDTADGLGGGWDKARILAIMKDSRVGSYGVVALVLSLLAKWQLLSSLDPAVVPLALIACHAASRFCATLLMAMLDYAREPEGDVDASKARPVAQRPSVLSLLIAAAFGLLPLACLPPVGAFAGLVIALLATFWLGAKCRRWLGGYTGDCLGAAQQLAELGIYLGVSTRILGAVVF